MSAAFKREPNREERMSMPSNDNNELREQVAELRSDIRHIQADVTEIKTDQREMSQRIDKLKDSLHTSRIWAFGLYVSLLFILVKGFKWL
jgi:uncharacterized protein YlxW (UPF0749 family)